MKTQKKLIEVAMPLDAINAAAVREKSIRHGHPSTFHLWWARRPLAAARSVIFSQMVDDPSGYVEELLANKHKKTDALKELRQRLREYARGPVASHEDHAVESKPTLRQVIIEQERSRLFRILEDLVHWSSTTDEAVLQLARTEILNSWRRTCTINADHPKVAELFDPNRLPAFHDPFAGGGTLPLEAQRMGLEAHASDLNPVSVMINKAMIEIPPKFSSMRPVHPSVRKDKALAKQEWQCADGIAMDVSLYGQSILEEAAKRIGHVYPTVAVTKSLVRDRPDLTCHLGLKLTVIAWLWVRTVKSPDPAYAGIHVPLSSSFMLSTRSGREAYAEPILSDTAYTFNVRTGRPSNVEKFRNGTKIGRGSNFRCLMSGTPIEASYIKAESVAGRMGCRLMAIVAENPQKYSRSKGGGGPSIYLLQEPMRS